MAKIYDVADPVMIYNASNEWTIVDAADVDACVAEGWSRTPNGDIHTAPQEFKGEVQFEKLSDIEADGINAKNLGLMKVADLLELAGAKYAIIFDSKKPPKKADIIAAILEADAAAKAAAPAA